MDELHDVDLAAEFADLRRTVTAQSARIADLEAQVADQSPVEERSTRRRMLRLAGAAVVGGAASLVGTQPAAAADVVLGGSNDAGSDSTSLTSSTFGATLTATNTNSLGTGLRGVASTSGTGVFGSVSGSGSAVSGFVTGSNGYALVGTGGAAQLLLNPLGGTTPPASGTHAAGEVVVNAGGFFACVTDGAPGTWRKLAGPATAGAFHALTPARVYDSRVPLPQQGLIAPGELRTISVANGRDNNGNVITPNLVPAGAIAVAANVTVTGTTGGFGFLSVNPGGVVTSTASTINWFGPGQNIANGVSLTLNTNRQLTIVCGNPGGSTHFIIDVAGYYL